jgi:hypothetical protein
VKRERERKVGESGRRAEKKKDIMSKTKICAHQT